MFCRVALLLPHRRMVPLRACGQPGAGVYHRGQDELYHPFAVGVLATTPTRISRISLFTGGALFPYFELLPTVQLENGG